MDYELGLRTLKSLLPPDGLDDFNVYEARLLENLHAEQLHGSTETLRSERAKIVGALNRLAQSRVGVSFNDLCLGKAPPAQQRPSGGSAATTSAAGWSTATVRQLLSAAFDDEELTTLCFDHFRPVYENFAAGMSKGQKIQQLLDYCERHDLLDQLLRQVERSNPAQYKKFVR